jgi:flagellar FliJ protein
MQRFKVLGYRVMKPRDSALRAKRFEAAEKARKVASLEAMIRDFETMVSELTRQIAAEEERTSIKDPAHFAYSTFAKAAAQRRGNLGASIADLKMKLDVAKRDHEDAASELTKLEPVDDRERLLRKGDPRAMAG